LYAILELKMHLDRRMKRPLHLLLVWLGLAGLWCTPSAQAQFYNGSQMTFGKNRVQYSEFQWFYYRFDRFETYFYLNGRELATFTAEYAQEQIPLLESRLEVNLRDQIQFIIYNSLSDLKQSNIGLMSEAQYNTGGITHIIGRKVFLYFSGDHRDFERQIRYGIARVLIDEMLYGGSITSQVTSNTLLVLPDWYVNGLVSYFAESWNTGIDSRVRDGVLTGRYDKFNRLSGEEAIYAGHSLWRYIEIEHGARSIPDIVYMTKVSKNVESGFLFVLGTSFKNLVNNWLDFYWRNYDGFEARGFPEEMQEVGKKPKTERVYTQARLSPDGRYLAYVTNELGRYILWVYDTESEKTRKVAKGGWKLDEKTDYSYPVLNWHPNGKILAFMTEAKGKIFLHYYQPSNRRKDALPFYRFEKITDFSYSHDGRLFILSAVQKGQSDLFVYNIASRTIDQLTDDIYDDLNPRFIRNSSRIIFSSNRPGDTLRPGLPYFPQDVQEYHDLFVYDYTRRHNVLRRITRTPLADERMPRALDEGHFSYLSDENGIFNRYVGRFDSTISYIDTAVHYRYFTDAFPLTDYDRNLLDYSLSPLTGKKAAIVYRNGYSRLFLTSFLPAGESPRLKLNQTDFRTSLDEEWEGMQADSLPEAPPSRRKVRFQTVREGTMSGEDTGRIDIRNYTFDRQAFINLNLELPRTNENGESAVPIRLAAALPKQRNYYVAYGINELVSQLDFAFLNSNYQAFTGGGQPIFLNPGLNALLKVGAADLLEDYRITGGVRLSSNLRNNEYLLSFSKLKSRLDKEFVFHRQVVEEEGFNPIYSLIRHQVHEFHYILKWPFSPVAAVRGSAILRNDRAVYLALEEQSLREPNFMRNWAALKGEYIYDATRSPGLNLYYGLRFKIFGEYYRQIENNQSDLVVLGMDFRHYTPLHRSLIWANRLAASTSFGSNKLIYYLGGVDNWLFPKFNQETPIDLSQNYAYQTLGTNMRGFHQNIRNGNSFLLLNSEIRFPLFRYFANRPIRSDFFNHFQVLGFGDVGTAWTGWDPYSSENSLFTRVIRDGPITVTLEEQKDPLVGGFGFGLRSRLLGYFVRADWAWGIEDRQVQSSVFYLSLSLDF
jgi:hypothetical protein